MKAIVVHITAGLEDLAGRADQSAERTAAYAAGTNRKVSWHSGSDTDSRLELLPPSFTAWHAAGYNSSTYGHEISKTSPDWRGMPAWWVTATLEQAARHLGPMARFLGIPIRKTGRAELDQAIARNLNPVGFVGHWELDPSRRSDPGRVGVVDTFPWSRFLDLCKPTQEAETMFRPDDVVDVLTTPDGKGRWHLTFDGGIRTTGTARFFGSVPGLEERHRLGFRGAMALLPHGNGYEIVDLKGNSYHFAAR